MILFYVFAYLVLFGPLLVYFPTLQQFFLYGGGLLILITNYSMTKKYLYLCRKVIMIGLLICLYIIFRSLIGGEVYLLIPTIRKLILDWILVFGILILWNKSKYSKMIEQVILNLGIIASLITLFLIAFPGINEQIKNLLFMDEQARGLDENRCYGMALGLTFSYPLVLSVISMFLFELKHSMKYRIVFLFLFVFAILFNARVGFVAILAYLLVKVIQKRSVALVCKIILGGGISVAFIIYSGLYDIYQETFDWGMEFLYMTSDFLFGTTYGPLGSHFSALAGRFLIFPESLHDWLIGSGLYLTKNSDVGFILQLNYGGLVFLGLIYYLFFHLFVVLEKNMAYKAIPYTLLILFLLANWKGDVLYQSVLFRLVFLLYLYYVSKNRLCNA